jgi:hypothetical protein
MISMRRRTFLKTAAASAIAAYAAPGLDAARAPAIEVLHNGIRLPGVWPPRLRSFAPEPLTPPYLLDPPAVISIDVGRQLFVDDFLIATTTLKRTFHHATYHHDNPLLTPRTPWEKLDSYADRTHTPPRPSAMVFSDGVFYDPAARAYKLWYMGGYGTNTCLAVSDDGLAWTRPSLDVRPGTNIVLDTLARDSNTVWLDHDERDPAQRFKMAMYYDKSMELFSSPDGIHWRHRGRTGPTGDRTTMFYDAFRRKWVFSIRDEDAVFGRMRRYWQTDDVFAGVTWRAEEPPCWIASDSGDRRRGDYDVRPQIYTLDAAAYESVLLGLFTMWRGETNDREKPNDICVGFSRDGFHWWRPDRGAFIAVSEHVGDWNWANVQSAGGCCLIVGDTLRFYVSGRAGIPGTSVAGVCSTGLATLRRDGFASMDGRGTLVTRPLRFSGGHLFVNAALGDGVLRAGVEDEDGRPLPNLSIADCVPVRGDGTALPVTWTDRGALARAANRPVRLRFDMTGGSLFAFWVSRAESGASGGFVAAGGPAFKGARDR